MRPGRRPPPALRSTDRSAARNRLPCHLTTFRSPAALSNAVAVPQRLVGRMTSQPMLNVWLKWQSLIRTGLQIVAVPCKPSQSVHFVNRMN